MGVNFCKPVDRMARSRINSPKLGGPLPKQQIPNAEQGQRWVDPSAAGDQASLRIGFPYLGVNALQPFSPAAAFPVPLFNPSIPNRHEVWPKPMKKFWCGGNAVAADSVDH